MQFLFLMFLQTNVINSLLNEKGNLMKKCEKLKKNNNKLLVILGEYQRKMWQYEKKIERSSFQTVTDGNAKSFTW